MYRIMEKVGEIKNLLKGLNKTFGENTLMIVGDGNTPKVETITTGVMSFDRALGGGFGKGRVVELVGEPSSGKTSLSLMTISEVQKAGGVCAFIDVEQALDFEYAQVLGVNVADLVVSQPDNAEQALEITDRLVESGLFDIIVVDSVAALVPKAELEGEMGDQRIGVLARLMAQATRKLVGKINKTKTCVIMLNQYRSMIGTYIPTKTTPGGAALAYAASQRVEISKGKQIKDGDTVLGGIMKVKVIKNKIAAPFKTAEVDMIFGKGVDKMKDLLTVAVNEGVVERSGSWFSFRGTKLGQGFDKVVELARDNPEMVDEIKSDVLKK